ncbi:hypothetical protein RCH18_002532 [Flavobacterium sp. PL11]|uniref:hypothetical protein n=1 Tax=Flavobacterium sp. PL11 TaxID=3071717 RepID=UPI002DF93EB7|nr:hypothetical protein [Flavobacterium sp. PL11]
MDILFICGSLERGRDGVGDYTRRLAAELIRVGHGCQIIALYDSYINSFTKEVQECENSYVNVYRISVDTGYKARLILTNEVIDKTIPDCISLQFVPYSFSKQGLPFWLPFYLKKLKGKHKWHIMFHELWIGMDNESSAKHKIIGSVQKLLVSLIVQSIKSDFLSTQNKLYQSLLELNNIKVGVLPICGNIPVKVLKSESKEFMQFVLFGTIHPGAPFNDFIDDLINLLENIKREIKFVFIGENGSEINNYIAVLNKKNISCTILGKQSEDVISRVLLESTFGISTTPYFQTEKSGVYAAYREHQLNTICIARKWTPLRGQYCIPQIINYKKNALKLSPLKIEHFSLELMGKQFITLIS